MGDSCVDGLPTQCVCVCGLNQLIGSFSRSVPNKLPSRQKLTLERDRRLFMGDTKAGAHLITTDNCLFPTKNWRSFFLSETDFPMRPKDLKGVDAL